LKNISIEALKLIYLVLKLCAPIFDVSLMRAAYFVVEKISTVKSFFSFFYFIEMNYVNLKFLIVPRVDIVYRDHSLNNTFTPSIAILSERKLWKLACEP
jgi:hypothetical protein